MTALALQAPRFVGRLVMGSLAHVGRFSLLVSELVRGLTEWRIWLPRTFVEAYNIGYGSLFIVLLISGFAGGVTALQAGYQWQSSLPMYVLGTLIVSSVVLELGPVLTALVLAGRIGARYAAELGTMRVTEQIDALESLGRSPASHLLIPRILAGLVMIPVLTIFANIMACLAGWYLVKQVLPITDADFVYGMQYYWRDFDGWYSIIKAFFFAGAITLIPCYVGFNTKQGAEGVGRATTAAVVNASVLILLLDVLLAKLLLNTYEMIEIIGLRKRFGEQVVLDGVDLVIHEGETMALLGPSGTGKSVLLKHIIGLIRPDHGRVVVDGQEVEQLGRDDLSKLRRQIGYVFQNGALFDSMNVFENVRLGLTDAKQYGDADFCRDRVAQCLALVNLAPETAAKFPAQLSGGMRKRVGIARAIAGAPKYLLYDEPTSGLDPVNADIIDDLVKRLDTELGVTSIMVTHDVRGAFRVADRLALLMNGRVVLHGTKEEFLASEVAEVKTFLERDIEDTSFAA